MTNAGVQLAIHYISKNTTESNKEKGSIICTASNAGLYAFPIAPIYSATKHGVIGLVRSLARSVWEKERIRINALAPAVIGITPRRYVWLRVVWAGLI
jgi:NAD(P)-dependent dehydrogenase (short-subunit alcohol dehydrogenase family)